MKNFGPKSLGYVDNKYLTDQIIQPNTVFGIIFRGKLIILSFKCYNFKIINQNYWRVSVAWRILLRIMIITESHSLFNPIQNSFNFVAYTVPYKFYETLLRFPIDSLKSPWTRTITMVAMSYQKE